MFLYADFIMLFFSNSVFNFSFLKVCIYGGRETQTEKNTEGEMEGETPRVAVCGVGVKKPELAS